MINWRIHAVAETDSTNHDARAGMHGDVYTATFQTAGRGRLDHRWTSPPGTNLLMSVVLDVADLTPETVATLPLVAGLAAVDALRKIGARELLLKWPNDVWLSQRKIAGILCERVADRVIVGIGVNVRQTTFPPELRDRATSLVLAGFANSSVDAVRDAFLCALDGRYGAWRLGGFSAVYADFVVLDALKGRYVSVLQNDHDTVPIAGTSAGVLSDGSLDVAGVHVYAGEVHVSVVSRESVCVLDHSRKGTE